MAMNVEMILRLIDQATGPIRGVESELDKLQRTAAKIDAQRTSGGGVKASVWLEQQQAIKKAQEQAEDYEKQLRSVDSVLSRLGGAAAGFAAAHAGLKLFKDEASAGANAVRNAVSLETAGFKASDIAKAQAEARRVSSLFPQFDRSQIEEQIIETTPALGSLEHALEFQEPLTRYRANVEAQDPGAGTGKGMLAIVRALEEFGAANTLDDAEKYLERFAKVANAFKKTVKPEDWYQFGKYTGSLSARNLSLDYIAGPAASLIAAIGGSTAGVDQRQFFQEIIGGRMSPKAAQAWVDAGFVPDAKDPRYVDLDSKGNLKGIKPGALLGQNTAKTNPFQWVHEIALPQLRRAGYSDEQIDAWSSRAMENPSVRGLFDFYRANKSRIDKDTALSRQAMGLEAADVWKNKDAATAFKALERQLENFKRTSAEPLMGPGTSGLHGVTSLLDWWESNVAKDRPWVDTLLSGAAVGGGLFAGAKGANALLSLRNGAGAASKVIGAPSDFATEFVKGAGGVERVLEVARGVGATLRTGLALGAVQWAGQWALGKAEEKAFGWTPEILARKEAEITRRAHEWWRSHGISLPWWSDPRNLPEPQKVPTLADAPAPQPAAPQVDATKMEEGRDKAREVGREIKEALEVKAEPSVETAGLEKALSLARQLRHELEGVGRAAANIRYGTRGLGHHSLHDGPDGH
ncbi:hypothetical protein [Methylosinus sp. KRF6]|uniref:hypothetical protein n=1 Tax=Methylosinus sp. KRF6 TaxID=2846853 RepID=UPI001C0D1E57|nr:hypothetical protein [Methylosinus sp. KRF6]MBU3889851.1 hypothetical protein [Methylosinus sp. KRF6]